MLGKARNPPKQGEAVGSRLIGKREKAAGRPVKKRTHIGRRTVTEEKDYSIYCMQAGDLAACTAVAAGLSVVIAWLFYRSAYGMLVMPVVWLVFYLSRKREGVKKQQQRLRSQFKECIRIVTASLYSGYSIENAFSEAEKELVQLLGKQEDMCRELHRINQQIRLNIPVETLLQNLAGRSGVEEIYSFGQVFTYAKRSGSDFARILKDTSERITEKAELEREIATMVAAKRMEQRIMNVIPLGILFFVEVTSPGFLQVMYTGMFGRVIMTVFLLVYGAAYLLSGKLVEIEI